jgi:hypothetical protein
MKTICQERRQVTKKPESRNKVEFVPMANMGKRLGLERLNVVDLPSLLTYNGVIHKIEDVIQLKVHLSSFLEIVSLDKRIWVGMHEGESRMIGQSYGEFKKKNHYWFCVLDWDGDRPEIKLFASGCKTKKRIEENVYLFSSGRFIRAYSRFLFNNEVTYTALHPSDLEKDLEEIHMTNGCTVFDLVTPQEFYEELSTELQDSYWNLAKPHCSGFFLDFLNNFYIKFNKKTKKIAIHSN